jgi:hypothetical protein
MLHFIVISRFYAERRICHFLDFMGILIKFFAACNKIKAKVIQATTI